MWKPAYKIRHPSEGWGPALDFRVWLFKAGCQQDDFGFRACHST